MPWYSCAPLIFRHTDVSTYCCLHERECLCWRFLRCARMRLSGDEVGYSGFNDRGESTPSLGQKLTCIIIVLGDRPPFFLFE